MKDPEWSLFHFRFWYVLHIATFGKERIVASYVKTSGCSKLEPLSSSAQINKSYWMMPLMLDPVPLMETIKQIRSKHF